ncbi:hypothetical protein GmHk_04G010370 [Glycine max]|nr:hypothetical protein GmHk_04G010370 [Glycine max]
MGFGYDDSKDTYKEVAMVVNKEALETKVIVHCMGDSYSKKIASWWSGFPRLGLIFQKKIDLLQHQELAAQNRKFDRCFTRPSTFLIQIYICLAFVFLPAFPNSLLRFTKSFQTLCFSMATSSKETAASGSPSVPSSSHQEQPELNIQPIQIIPGQASVPEKLVPRRPQGVKIAENPSPATSPREVDTEMDKKIRSIVSSILKDASVPEADEDVPTSSNPNVSVPDVKKDVPTSSAPNAEALPSPSEEGSTEEDDQAAEETPAPRAPEPAPGNLIDLEEVESDEEPIANRLAPGIAERLQSRKGKTPLKRSGRIKTMAQKKSTPITPATSRRSKVAIPSKKRKEISSSDSDEDVELDVSTSKKAKTSGKKVPGNVPDAPLDNISFHSIGNAERWKFVYQRRLALERELGRAALDCKEIMDLIKAAGLLKTVSKLGDCYEGLVREFIVNIPSDISNRKSDDYQRVFVRGKCVKFSPAVINKYLGRPTDGVIDIAVSEHQIAKEITAKQVQYWPKKGKLSAGKLSVKYAILHRIGAANWVPTNHTSTIATGLGKFLYAVGTKSKFNFGNYIFDQTVKHSESFAVKLPIAFPTVLCGIMLSQHPNMLNYTDSVMKRESPLSLHYKLFEGTHVPDIVSTSVSTSGKAAASGAVSKDALIAELKDTCKVLEATIKATTEKKMELELLIKRLSENFSEEDRSPPASRTCSPESNGTYIYLLLPRGLNIIMDNLRQYLGVFWGCMCFFHCEEETRLSVWQMKEFGMVDSWTMLLKVNCEGLQFFNYYYYQQFPLWMTENGDFLLLDNRLEQIESRTNVGLLNSFDYAQSLVLLY